MNPASCLLLTSYRPLPRPSPHQSQGIYRAKFDPATGVLSDCKIVAEVQCSPSWFRLHPTLPVLYCTNETFDGSDSAVTAFGLTSSGGLERMGRVTTSGGSACHLSVHPDGAYIAATNHGQDFGGNAGGSVAVISVCPESGDVLAQTDFVMHEAPTDPELLAGEQRTKCPTVFQLAVIYNACEELPRQARDKT